MVENKFNRSNRPISFYSENLFEANGLSIVVSWSIPNMIDMIDDRG